MPHKPVPVTENKEKEAPIKLTVNGEPVELIIGFQVQPWHTLVRSLRETLGLKGTSVLAAAKAVKGG